MVSRKGNTPTNVPKRVGNLWLTYDFADDWQGGVDTRYVAQVYADNANTLTVPAYTLFGSFLRYKVDSHTSVTGRVRNPTNAVYAEFAHAVAGLLFGIAKNVRGGRTHPVLSPAIPLRTREQACLLPHFRAPPESKNGVISDSLQPSPPPPRSTMPSTPQGVLS